MKSEKQQLRLHFEAARREFAADPARKGEADRRIAGFIRSLACYRAADCVAIYAADASEPDLSPLMQLDPGKDFLFPRYVAAAKAYEFALVRDLSELAPGRFGLREPIPDCPAPESPPDLYLVPEVAFDRSGVRLGRGGGFYDRLLENARGAVIGVGYFVQLAEALPAEAHDRKLDFAVTEREFFSFAAEIMKNNAEK